MSLQAGNANQSNSAANYPPQEWSICRQLVRMIRTAQTWQDMVEASEALFQVELKAKQLRDEWMMEKAQKSAISSMRGQTLGQCNGGAVLGQA